MRDKLLFEQLHNLFAEDFKVINEGLESVSNLYKNLPLNDSSKKLIFENSFKSKSAYYACLVNSNIDILLIPEYLDSKLSRNILIKKETEQYYRSIENFHLHTIQKTESIYDCILFNEEVEQVNSFDLFSTQAPESASCPEDLKLIFEQWNIDFNGFEVLETIFYSLLDWHAFNQNSFSNKRQIVLFLNFQLWKQYGNIFQKLNLESYLFEHWNNEKLDPIQAIKGIIDCVKKETSIIETDLKHAYRDFINYTRLNYKQKIVSNYLFGRHFKVNLSIESGSLANNSLIKQIQKKGFVDFSELNQHPDILQQRKNIEMLIESGVLELNKIDGIVGLYLNTSFSNKNKYLYQFQNIKVSENKLKLEDFLNQSISNPIVPIEKLILSPEPIIEVKVRRAKAFFG